MRWLASTAAFATVLAVAAPSGAMAAQDSDANWFTFNSCGERQSVDLEPKPGGHALRPISPPVGTPIVDESGRTIGAIVDIDVARSAAGESLRWTGQAGGALCTGELAGPVDSADMRFTWSYAPSPQPRLTSLRMRLQAVGPPGPGYHVIVHIAARVCALRGPMHLDVREELFDASDDHRFKHRQRSRCQTYHDHWKLADDFFGVGTYIVRVQAFDRYANHSRTLSRRHVTVD